MSDELRIELQVDTDTKTARSQLDSLIDEYKNKKPIDLKLQLGNTNLETFQANIKSITSDLEVLAGLKFSNLKTIETSLKNISKIVSDYQNLTTSNKSTKGTSVLDGLGVKDETIERLENDHEKALAQVKSLKDSAEFLKDGFEAYQKSLKEAYKTFETDNKDIFASINEFENMFDTSTFKKLVKYKKEFNDVVREYNSLGVSLTDVEKVTNEKYDGTMATKKYSQYMDTMGLSAEKFEEMVEKAKELNARKRQLLKNLENSMKKATEEEKAAFKVLSNLYDDMPTIDTSEADAVRNTLTSVLSDDMFKLDFGNLDLRFEDDFRQAYDRFFDILKDVQKEYNNKFKDVDGFEGFDIFDTDSLKKQNDNLEKEIDKTVGITKKLTNLGIGAIDTLGLDSNAINVFEILGNSAEELEDKLESLKTKFNNAFEISSDSSKSLDKIREALIEINKLTDEQKQTFFDFGLDAENIKKAKNETEELKSAIENTSRSSFDGLIESYSRLEDASGNALREIEKIRLSSLSKVTLNYGYEEDDFGNIERQLKTAEFSDNISKRTKEILKEYTNASKDLIKAQKEYFDAVNNGKSSDDTINKLSDNVKDMEKNLSNVRNCIRELEEYPDVMDAINKSFNDLDAIRHRQMETDALKIIDKKDLAEANKLLKESKTLIDNISKDNIQLQKDLNAGYENSSKGLEDRIKSQEKNLTSNISKLMSISNSKAAIDQVFSYQLEKAQKTSIEIARINDKANKTTGTKTVDEQDQYLKQYKQYLTELKSIQKSLTKESNETARTEKIFQLDNTFKQLDQIKSKLNEVKSEVAQGLFDKTMRELDLNLASGFSKTCSELDKVEEKITKLSRSDYANNDMVSSAQRSISALRNTLEKGLDSLGSKELSNVLVEIEKLKQAAKDIDLDIKLSKDSDKIEAFISGVTNRLETLQSTANNIDISHITSQFSQLSAGSDRNSVIMKSINDDVRNLEQSLRNTGNVASETGLNIRNFFGDLGDSLRTFTLGEIIGDAIVDSLSQTWDVIKEMDAAMSNLRKVADESDINTLEKLDNIRSQAISISKEVGMASSDVINAIADTLQAGVGGMEESIQVARSAMILANVGDMTQEVASESLNTIINGFDIKPLKEIDVQVGGLTQKTTELANAMDLLNYAG